MADVDRRRVQIETDAGLEQAGNRGCCLGAAEKRIKIRFEFYSHGAFPVKARSRLRAVVLACNRGVHIRTN
jgi:hypothetical protein